MEILTAGAAALDVHRLVNRTAVPYPAERGVKETFEAVAARLPHAPAVIHAGRVLSYRDLNEKANGLASMLRDAGVTHGSSVVVSIARSPELVAALLAIIKCGACYVPIDSEWPDRRLAWIVAKTRPAVLVTDEPDGLAQRLPGLRRLRALAPAQAANPPGQTGADDIAYINFTSGSTGQPKGVPIPHRGIQRLVLNARYARLDQRAILIHLAPVTFDAATFEIWGALLNGGTCVLYPSRRIRLSELKQTIEAHRVTIVFLTTALFNAVIDEGPAALDSVDTILTGGESHSRRHLAEAVARYGPGKVVNVYGPTECTTFATYYPLHLDQIPHGPLELPIGLPIQNTRLYLITDGRLCPPGEVGEICLAGPGLSPGYLAMPEITRDHFVDCQINGITERIYRTGDRGYFLPDGTVVFQGRLDDQVKINGYRIELGEITHHLDRHPHVKISFVAVTRNAAGDQSLAAFVVPRDEQCTPAGIADYLRTRLPGYMVPATIQLHDSFPLSATGKVDREALLRSMAGSVHGDPQQKREEVPGLATRTRPRPDRDRASGLDANCG